MSTPFDRVWQAYPEVVAHTLGLLHEPDPEPIDLDRPPPSGRWWDDLRWTDEDGELLPDDDPDGPFDDRFFVDASANSAVYLEEAS